MAALTSAMLALTPAVKVGPAIKVLRPAATALGAFTAPAATALGVFTAAPIAAHADSIEEIAARSNAAALAAQQTSSGGNFVGDAFGFLGGAAFNLVFAGLVLFLLKFGFDAVVQVFTEPPMPRGIVDDDDDDDGPKVPQNLQVTADGMFDDSGTGAVTTAVKKGGKKDIMKSEVHAPAPPCMPAFAHLPEFTLSLPIPAVRAIASRAGASLRRGCRSTRTRSSRRRSSVRLTRGRAVAVADERVTTARRVSEHTTCVFRQEVSGRYPREWHVVPPLHMCVEMLHMSCRNKYFLSAARAPGPRGPLIHAPTLFFSMYSQLRLLQ